MAEEQGVVRRIAWAEICPWLLIFRTFRIAVSLPVLSLATLGALLTPAGWSTADTLFLRDVDRSAVVGLDELVPVHSTPTRDPAAAVRDSLPAVYWSFVAPVERLLQRETPVRQVAYYLFGWGVSIVIWSFCAGTITRIAVAELGCRERVGLFAACSHTRRKIGWYIASPLFPLSGAVMAALPIALLGLLMRTDWGLAVGAIFWPLALIGGLVITLLTLGVLLGWPLMWPTVSSEKHGDAFEAFSRSYAYVFQRLVHYLFYVTVAVLFGAACWMLVSHVAAAVIDLSYTAAAWGAGTARVDELIRQQGGNESSFAGTVTGVCAAGIWTIAGAFKYSLFFCASSAIYLLMRRDVDHTDFDDVYLGDDDQIPSPPGTKDTADVAEPDSPKKPDSASTDGDDATKSE